MSATSQSAQIAYLNGEHCPLHEARIPVLDRGLLFGDAVYEVIPVYAGRPFLLREHLQRLENSLAGIALANPHNEAQWIQLLQALIEANGGGDLSLYLQVTRGADATRDHRLPEHPQPNVIAFCQRRKPTDPDLFKKGVAAITLQDPRWSRCEIKSTSLLANVLASRDAAHADAAEAILLRDGLVMEGASSNVFAVLDGQIVTPALRPAILPGITRALVLKLARENAVPAREGDLAVEELHSAQELWITSSTRDIYPVTRLDHTPVGQGHPGEITIRMQALIHACQA